MGFISEYKKLFLSARDKQTSMTKEKKVHCSFNEAGCKKKVTSECDHSQMTFCFSETKLFDNEK